MISDLKKSGTIISSNYEAIKAAAHIDAIWFKNGKLMPAVMEVEHSTGITSGLDRMKTFQSHAIGYNTNYVVVADSSDREKFLREKEKEHYKELNCKFFSYAAVEELYSLVTRRKINGSMINQSFFDAFWE